MKKAQKGAPDALKAVGDDGEPVRNPVCKLILGCIAGVKRAPISAQNLNPHLTGGLVMQLTVDCRCC
jgi:hypothetical protein